MKKIKSYYILFLPALLIFAGCKKDFFELNPTSQLSPSSFWQTENDATAALNACYAVLSDVNEEVMPYLDVITPNAYGNYPWEGWQGISKSSLTPQIGDNYGVTYIWQGGYKGIGRTNTLLANISKPEMNDSLRSRIKGEALFLRAYFYFNIANYFGGTPLILDPPDLGQAKLPRNTKEEVIAQVLKDLDEAAATSLPDSYTGSDIGRVTKGAVLALKVRVLLYEKKWAETAAVAKNIIDNKAQYGYDLFASYRELFLPQNENNKEVIFDVQYKSPDNPTNWDLYIGISDGAITPGWSSIEPTTDFVDDYEMKDGSTWSTANPVADPANKYNNRDPRLDQTVFRKGRMYNGVPYPVDANGWPGLFTGFSFKKYTVYDESTNLNVGEGQSGINGIILRYADVLLMYAEAQNEATGPDASVFSAVNAVRTRAGMPDLPAGLNQVQMRDHIRHERRIEFVLEGLYYSDVRRWNIADEVLNRDIILNGASSPGKGDVDERTFDPSKNYLWPIPQREIDNSQKALEQNPNY